MPSMDPDQSALHEGFHAAMLMHVDVEVTSRRCINIEAMLFKRHVLTGIK